MNDKNSWKDRDADNTYLIVGGLILAHIIVSCIFAIIFLDDDEAGIISAELMMAIINLPVTIISFAVGKKVGQMQNDRNDKEKEK